MSYRIFETENFSKILKSFSLSGASKIREKLNDYVYPILRVEPCFGPNIKKLKGYEPPTWRYRIGDWRFFYEIDTKSKIVFMTVAFHRSEAYKR